MPRNRRRLGIEPESLHRRQGSYYVLCTDMDGGPGSGAPESNPLKIGEALETCRKCSKIQLSEFSEFWKSWRVWDKFGTFLELLLQVPSATCHARKSISHQFKHCKLASFWRKKASRSSSLVRFMAADVFRLMLTVVHLYITSPVYPFQELFGLATYRNLFGRYLRHSSLCIRGTNTRFKACAAICSKALYENPN